MISKVCKPNYIKVSYETIQRLRNCPRFRELSQDKKFIINNAALGFIWEIEKNRIPPCCQFIVGKTILGDE